MKLCKGSFPPRREARGEPNVINYCVFALRHCGDENELFPGSYEHSDCVNFMNDVVSSGDYTEEGFTSFTDSDTNSIGCLNNRIMLAAMDSTTYCGQGQIDPAFWVPDGEGVCAAASSDVATGDFLPTALSLLIIGIGVPALILRRRHWNQSP